MSFATPLFLLGLLALPLAVLAYRWRLRRPRRDVVRFPGAATLAAIAPAASRWRRHVPASLFALALLALVLALARPQTTVAVAVERASIVLVTDASGSMAATDVEPSRLDAVRGAAANFLEEVPDELQVGFVGFSSTPHTVARPTTDREEIAGLMAALRADGGTATGEALAAALAALRPDGKRERAPAAVLLLSDGRTTEGRDPVQAAREARRLGVPVYTVSLGTPGGTVPGPAYRGPLSVPPDPATMRRVAEVSGGRFFDVKDAARLSSIYERLGSQLGTRQQEREVTAAFAAGGLVLLLAAVGLSVRRFGRLP